MQPVKGGFLVKDTSGQWTTQSNPPPPKTSDEKAKEVARAELQKDLNSATPYQGKYVSDR